MELKAFDVGDEARKTICLRGRVGRYGDEIENQVARDVQNLRAAVGILADGLNDQANFGQLAILRANVARKAGRAGVNANAGDEPGIGSLRFLGQGDLSGCAGRCLRGGAIGDREKLLKRCVGPHGIALRRVLGIWRRDVADGDQIREIGGLRRRGK